MGDIIVWRPDKGSYLETIYYEIDIWRFCFHRLVRDMWPDVWDSYVYLEGLLLHYRGLVEFFSGRHHRERIDLSFADPDVWAERPVSQDEADSFRQPAAALEDRGDWTDISQFLQHCTVRRFIELRRWPVTRMFQDLNQVVTRFENSFPRI
jgi:hypothetical protein